MARRRRRKKLKRWLYFPIAAAVVVIGTLLFLRFGGDGAKKARVEPSPSAAVESAPPVETPQPPPERLFAYYDGGKWGYKDQNGNVYNAIPVQYDAVQAFSEDLAFVGSTAGGVTTWSLIDVNGNVIASNLPYSELRPFSGGFAAVKGLEGWGFIDRSGAEVVAPTYDMVGDCSTEKLVQGRAVSVASTTVVTDMTAGDMTAGDAGDAAAGEGNADGATGMDIPSEGADGQPDAGGAVEGAGAGLTPTDAAGGAIIGEEGEVIECGLAVVCKNNIFGYVAPAFGDEAPAIKLVYNSANKFGDSMAFVGVKQGEGGSVQYQIIGVYAEVRATISGEGTYFSDAMAVVKEGSGQYSYYDGRTMTKAFINVESGEAATFEDAKDFSEGLAPVKINGLWGYINKDGATPVIPTMFTDATPFSEGLAVVKDESGLWGAIDANGQMRIACAYDELESFKGGYALGRKQDTYYAVSAAGQEVSLYIRSTSSDLSGNKEMLVRLDEGTLRVRAEPSTESAQLAYVDNGTRVTVLGEEGEWSQVVVNGNITGYVMTKYLVEP